MKSGIAHALAERITLDLNEQQPVGIIVSHFARKQPLRYDMHFALELGVVLRGRMERVFQDARVTLGPGEAWIEGMWEPHGWRPLAAGTDSLAVVMLPQWVAGLHFAEAPGVSWMALFTAPAAGRAPLPTPARRELLGIAGRLIAIPDSDVWSRVRQSLAVMELMILLRRHWSAPDVHTDLRAPARLDAALRLVFESARFVSASEAARVCGLGRNRFQREFELLMGLSFPKFSLGYRLARARRDLIETNEPLKTLAARWGFTDASHMHRHFLRAFQRTPAEIRHDNTH